MLGGGFGLVQPGQAAIMALVQPPVLVLGQPQAAHCLERQMQRLDRASLERSEGQRGQHALVLQQLSRSKSLGRALFGHVDIPPAGEAVLKIPLRLAVADQDQAGHRGPSNAAEEGKART